MMENVWKRLRKDEYVFNNKVLRMTKSKQIMIKKLDTAVLHDERYA